MIPDVNKIIAWENGELDENETIDFFSGLVKSGLAWQLQGMYGRMAEGLISSGYLDRQGKILKHFCEDDISVPIETEPARDNDKPVDLYRTSPKWEPVESKPFGYGVEDE